MLDSSLMKLEENLCIGKHISREDDLIYKTTNNEILNSNRKIYEICEELYKDLHDFLKEIF